MLTREDCLALCELSPEEVAAIAEHEHVPEMVAMELGNYLVHTHEGEARIRQMIVDDIEQARAHKDYGHMSKLVAVLRHFCDAHPA